MSMFMYPRRYIQLLQYAAETLGRAYQRISILDKVIHEGLSLLAHGTSVYYIVVYPTVSPLYFHGIVELTSRPDCPGLVPASSSRLVWSIFELQSTASNVNM